MDDRHASQRYLEEPEWARGSRPQRRPASAQDLTDLRGLVPAVDVVRRAARNVSPLSVTSPSAWMLRDALARAHGLEVGQIFPRASLDLLLAPIIKTFIGAGDHVAVSAPCRREFLRQVLGAGARYVDVGRDRDWMMQADAFERLVGDGQLRAAIVGRPDLPTGTLTSLTAIRQGLHAGLMVVVDETLLCYADSQAGLPRVMGPKADTALLLLDDDTTPTDGLIVLRSVPGLGPGHVVYAVGEMETLRRLWCVDSVVQIAAPVAAAAWLALDHTAKARRVIAERCTIRAELRTAIQGIGGYVVTASGGPCLLVQRPGVEGAQLCDALLNADLAVVRSEHPSWRESVALGIPLDGSLERVVQAFRDASQCL